jgi:hypothetical protein
MLAGFDWPAIFAEALPYEEFLRIHGSEEQRRRWAAVEARVQLTAAQRELLGGFVRRMPVLCLAGAWCGDCAQQVPILRHIAAAAAQAVELRLLDREARPDLRDALSINGGHRVPVVVFLSEDWQVCSVVGDRVLAFYRQMAAERLGPACPTGLLPPGEALLAEATAQWLAEFERIQLMLRLTGRLRERHGD